MRKRFGVAMLAIAMVVCWQDAQNVSAVSQDILISQVQVGPTGSLTSEFIELYNNSENETEITNWCLYYASSGQTQAQIGSKLTCFLVDDNNIHLFLPSHSFAFAISTALAAVQPALSSDLTFLATLAAAGGHVRMLDDNLNVVDKVGWGSAMSPEGVAVASPTTPKVLQRKASATINVLQDTDNNSLDFELADQRTNYTYGAIYEKNDVCKNIEGIQEDVPSGYSTDGLGTCSPPPVDLCDNIDGMQVTLPLGYDFDVNGDCLVDACMNINGIQDFIPEGKDSDGNGNCIDHDYCVNLVGLQTFIPDGYVLNLDNECLLDLLPIRVNELLANAIGSDDGNEFIEIYNPNSIDIDLSFYRLKVGIDSPKLYSFPSGSKIDANGHKVFSDHDIAFTLINSASQVRIVTADNQQVDEPPAYSNAGDGLAWALIAGSWQYTNQPTPGYENTPSLFELEDIEEVKGLKPCAPNQYRNPETNRCRLIVTVGSTLTPCKVGQYRNELTNRCRSIAADANTLTPCNANQERNPETNRCRLISSVGAELSPCKEGQERNTATNRCRNVVSSIPDASFAVQPIADSGSTTVGWWAVGGISAIALGYAVWEWRSEFIQAVRRLSTFFHSSK